MSKRERKNLIKKYWISAMTHDFSSCKKRLSKLKKYFYLNLKKKFY